MSQSYDHQAIEKKWRQRRQAEKLDEVDVTDAANHYYCLDMFPYPSGVGLHVGHWRGYVLSDYYTRYQRLQGKSVLHPMGFDAFGLPAENAAIANHTHPQEYNDKTIPVFIRQLEQIGAAYDWSRTIDTSKPEYYRWTQWLFLQLYKHGYAEKRLSWVNWCPKDQTVLANEQVISGKCERCGSVVTKKQLSQWYFRITDFAQELLDGLETINWFENVKTLQRNWIGRSEGATVIFKGEQVNIPVFTTRVDTIYGVNAIVLAPEHPDVLTLTTPEHTNEVRSYIEKTREKSELDRQAEQARTGVFTGSKVFHPFSQELLPVWVADYVLPSYGTGAVMSVPAHDERDYEFSRNHELPVRPVIIPRFIQDYEPGRYQPGQPTINREGVIVFVKHWHDNTYLGLKWKEVAWGTLLTGSVEEGETPEQTVLKEIREETGYLHARIVKKLGLVDGLFYHVPKQTNKLVQAHIFVVELEDDKQEKVDSSEVAKHELQWLRQDELAQFLTAQTHQYALQLLSGEFRPYSGDGRLINSGLYDGLTTAEAKEKITQDLAARGLGQKTINYRLRDWLVSRQRYWGAPIPIVYDPEGNPHPVPEDQLPVALPTDVEFNPGGESPIKRSREFAQRVTAKYGAGWTADTDTLDTFVDSSWYFLRFLTPHDATQAFDSALVAKWLPVDLYIGGIEHAILHLLYARFIYRLLVREGYIKTDFPEPFKQVFNIGMVELHGAKMSKSKGNAISPDELVEHYGTDALRGYELFLGPLDNSLEWNPRGINGVHRWLIKIYQQASKVKSGPSTAQRELFDQYLTTIMPMIKQFRLNTAISAAMVLLNNLAKSDGIDQEVWERYLLTIAPIAPFLTEELWSQLGHEESIFRAHWPETFGRLNPVSLLTVLVDQKFVGQLPAEVSLSETDVRQTAKQLPVVAAKLTGREVVKVIYKPGELLNFITREIVK